jgi:hypothetical protein
MGVTGNRGWSASSLSPFSVSYVHNGDTFRSPFRDRDSKGFVDAIVEEASKVQLVDPKADEMDRIVERFGAVQPLHMVAFAPQDLDHDFAQGVMVFHNGDI